MVSNKTCRLNMATKLMSQIFIFWNWKNNHQIIFFFKIFKYFLNFHKRNVCLRILADAYVYKISSRYLEKRLSLPFSMQKCHFLHYLGEFRHFSFFNFCLIWAVQKVLWGHFFAFFTKIWPKNIYYTTRTHSFKFDLFDLVTLDVFIWHKVTKDLGGT